MGRGRGVLEELVWICREVQSCWCWRLWRIVDARWWRWGGWGEVSRVGLYFLRPFSRAEGGGSSVVAAEGAISGGVVFSLL